MYYDAGNPYEHLEIVRPELLQVGHEQQIQVTKFTAEVFLDGYTMTIAYRGGALEPIYPLFVPEGVTFLLDDTEVECSPDQELNIWLTSEEHQMLTNAPGHHQVEKALSIRIDDPSKVDSADAGRFDGPPTVSYRLVVENVISTTQIIMPNGLPFGPANPHLLFEDRDGTVSIRFPEIPPDDIEMIVTQGDGAATVYTVGRDFSVSEYEGEASVTFSAQQIAEGRYEQLALVAANFDGHNLEEATLASLDGVNITQAVRAITLGAYYEPGSFERYLSDELAQIAALGANHVGVAVVWFMPDKSSDDIRPAPSTWSPGQFGVTHSEEAMREFAEQAHELGLRVDISLQLVCDFGLSHCWAGSIRPRNQAGWDEAYTDYIVQMAKLAQELEIDRLVVTNELESMQRREDFMLDLIRQVRQVYDGEIMICLSMWGRSGFGGDGGSGGYRNVPASVLQAVDYVGLNLYVSGARDGRATIEEMVERMIPQMDGVAEYYQSIGINNLTITEAGASIMDGGSVVPWNLKFPEGTSLDLQEQADYYAAFLQALQRSELGPMVTGVTFWSWDLAWHTLEGEILTTRPLSIAGNPLVHQVLAEQWGGSVP